MDLRLELGPHDHLLVHLREGTEETAVAVPGSRPGADSLRRALQAAIDHGYGECFWPGVEGGHYWWMLRRDHETLEVVVMWSRGGASGWQHVFRATDAAAWFSDQLDAEVKRLEGDNR